MKTKRVLTIVSNDFDDLEFFYPLIRLKEEGYEVVIAAEEANKEYLGKFGLKTKSEVSFKDINITKFDGIIIPGGWAPDYLRRLPLVLDFVRYLHENKKIIGAICHAGWVLSSAGILKDVRMTSTPGIKDDMMYAGAIWEDKAVIRDANIVTARRPPDLPLYLPELIKALESLS